MTRDEIAKEFDLFFEFDTEDRSTVTSVSAKLFAERMAALAVSTERERVAAWVEDMCVGLDAKTIANGIRNNVNDDIRAFEVRK